MARITVVFLAAVVLLVCCAAKPRADGCVRTGCSGELCASEQLTSACIFDPRFECYRSARCERQADGGCGFSLTPELARCLAADAGSSAR